MPTPSRVATTGIVAEHSCAAHTGLRLVRRRRTRELKGRSRSESDRRRLRGFRNPACAVHMADVRVWGNEAGRRSSCSSSFAIASATQTSHRHSL
jgi:hypothetical protein